MAKSKPLIAASAGIIPALDVDDLDRMRRIVEALAPVPGVVGFKLGAVVALRHGLQRAIAVVREFSDLPVLYDHQKAGTDIPSMSDGFTKVCSDAGADGLVLFPLAGREAVRQFAKRTRNRGMTPLVGGELPYPEYRARHGGFVHDGALGRILEGPDEKEIPVPRARGVIALDPEACTVCMLCARECPDWCIYIEGHKEEQQPEEPGGRVKVRAELDRFDIDYGLCMYCGICVDVCPFDALFWSPEYEYSEHEVVDLLHDKGRLTDWLATVPDPPPLEPS